MPHVSRRNSQGPLNVPQDMPRGRLLAIAIALLALTVSACSANSGAGASTPSPSVTAPVPTQTTSAPATPNPVTTFPQVTASPVVVSRVSSESQAAALVFASNPQFASIVPSAGAGAVGQSSSYSTSQTMDG